MAAGTTTVEAMGSRQGGYGEEIAIAAPRVLNEVVSTVLSNVAAAPPGSSFEVKTKLSDGVSTKKSDDNEGYARLLRVPEVERAPAGEESRQESVGTLESKEVAARQESGATDETSSLSTSWTGGHTGPSLKVPESGVVPVATVPGVDLKKSSEPAEDEVRYHWVEPR